MSARLITWIVVGDEDGARIFETAAGKPWEVVARLGHALDEEGDGDVASRHGHHLSPRFGSPPRASAAAMPEIRDFAAQRFARELADRLHDGFDKAKFDELLLVAPPPFLEMLRDELDVEVRTHVSGYIAKDLSGLDARAIRERLVGHELEG